jgi:hypothetical protein
MCTGNWSGRIFMAEMKNLGAEPSRFFVGEEIIILALWVHTEDTIFMLFRKNISR